MNRVSRRSFVRAIAATGGLIGAQLLGLFPELSLARAGGGPVRGRELSGDEFDRAFRAVASRPDSSLFRGFLARGGFHPSGPRTAVSVEGEDGGELGRSFATTFAASATGKTARLVEQQAGSANRASLAIWSDADPSTLTIYGNRGGAVVALGHIATRGRVVTVTESDGREHRLDLSGAGRAAKTKSGALASVAGPEGTASEWTCTDVCSTVSLFICGLTCEYSFYVACAVVLLLTGLPGLACFLVSFLVCFVSCKWVESVVCVPICS